MILAQMLRYATFGPFWMLLVLPYTALVVQFIAVGIYFALLLVNFDITCDESDH
jgi:hypothetical protein